MEYWAAGWASWRVVAFLLGLMLDRVFGEPARFHPLVGFGTLAMGIERGLNFVCGGPWGLCGRLIGAVAWCLAVMPWCGLAWWGMSWIQSWSVVSGWAIGGAVVFEAVILGLALGGRSLEEHARRVAGDLAREDLESARCHVGWIVSRETSALDEEGVARACIESTLENGNDAIFGALFWFACLGAPGVIMFRLANTLDAMWGYKTPRYYYFGWAAARIDDILNFVPSRLTALTYAVLGETRHALQAWGQQRGRWESPNAGPVMAAGAGALGLKLGGSATYHGRIEVRPLLGLASGGLPRGADIERAVSLLRRGTVLWGVAMILIGLSF